jgi:malonyl-CoA O-methyltransferase
MSEKNRVYSTIDPVAARRWAQLPVQDAPWLHEEIGRRMAERLALIKLPVQSWADASTWRGGAAAHAGVATYFPKARVYELTQEGSLQTFSPQRGSSWWQRWRGSPKNEPNAFQGTLHMIWANMCAHQAADPGALLEVWRKALAPGGFLMFSCFGPDTLLELRSLYARLGWAAPAQNFTDLHDWGDWLLTAGFAEPVMDMERLTLTFPSASRLLAELRGLGRNFHPQRFTGLRTRAWRAHLEAQIVASLRTEAKEPLSLTFEIIYGHALAVHPRHAVREQTEISLGEFRAALKRQRP